MKGTKNITIDKIANNSITQKQDCIVEESPLQIIIAYGAANERKRETLSVTMRTPGDDFNMVTGFLFCESIIKQATDILSIKFMGNPDDETLQENAVLVELASHVAFNIEDNKRNFVSAASCGFCGKTNADIIQQQVFAPLNNTIQLQPHILYDLPALLNHSQNLFAQTGGAHAVALIALSNSSGGGEQGKLTHICEDVGRHNAMDKLVGVILKKKMLPLNNYLVLFSGRLGYELVQKSLMVGIPMVCAIGAPSSLALELAEDNGMTIIGFLKNISFNIYCGAERIIQS
ncbi:formate dehydrogenase accessory sulfurtransferase FdhD [soil metagenome]